jgi:hemolysin III
MSAGDQIKPAMEWRQSLAEEIANSVSHGAGVIGAAVGAPFLLQAAVERGSNAFTVGTIVFTVTMLLLYLNSAVYHSWPRTPFKGVLQKLDHSAIFLLIAGSYTPFALGPLRGPWGWGVLIVIWTMAAIGVALKTVKGAMHRPRLAVTLYLVMGWMVLLVLRPLAMAIDGATMFWLVAGGVVYTSGVFFFLNDHKRYCHFIWHLFVLGGTCCHYFAVLSYAT